MGIKMENTKIKIPTQHYVGMQKRSNDLPLGFLTPYGTDAASKKRMSTVDIWSNSRQHSAVSLPSKVIDNIPMTGFKLSETIKRSTGWGKGNVVWRIADPRGFELEITNNNLMQIMICTIIQNGEILSPCVWGRKGAENVLIPTDSSLYKHAVENTKRQNKTVSVKSLKVGNTILLQNGTKGKYLGAFYPIASPRVYWSSIPLDMKYTISDKKKHFILTNYPNSKSWKKSDPVIQILSSMKISEIVDDSEDTTLNCQKFINDTVVNCNIEFCDGSWTSETYFPGVVNNICSMIVDLKMIQILDLNKYLDQYGSYSNSRALLVDIGNAEDLGIIRSHTLDELLRKRKHNAVQMPLISKREFIEFGIFRKRVEYKPPRWSSIARLDEHVHVAEQKVVSIENTDSLYLCYCVELVVKDGDHTFYLPMRD